MPNQRLLNTFPTFVFVCQGQGLCLKGKQAEIKCRFDYIRWIKGSSLRKKYLLPLFKELLWQWALAGEAWCRERSLGEKRKFLTPSPLCLLVLELNFQHPYPAPRAPQLQQRSSASYKNIAVMSKVPMSWPLRSLCTDSPLLFLSSAELYPSRSHGYTLWCVFQLDSWESLALKTLVDA